MKKTYQKPETQVVLMQHRTCLLSGSPQSLEFVDDTPADFDWDFDGGM